VSIFSQFSIAVVIMETDQQQPQRWTVEGKAIGVRGNQTFISFQLPSEPDVSKVAMFRSHRFFLNGEKLKSSFTKPSKFVELYKEKIKDQPVWAVVQASETPGTHETLDGLKVETEFYSACAWVGTPIPEEKEINYQKPNVVEKPNIVGTSQTQPESGPQIEKLICQEGTMVYKNLSGAAFIEFILNGSIQFAQFTARVLHLGDSLIDNEEYRSWPRDKKAKVPKCRAPHAGLTNSEKLTFL
jgi:hypothetical protein